MSTIKIPTPWWIWILFWISPIILFKIWMYRKARRARATTKNGYLDLLREHGFDDRKLSQIVFVPYDEVMKAIETGQITEEEAFRVKQKDEITSTQTAKEILKEMIDLRRIIIPGKGTKELDDEVILKLQKYLDDMN